MPTLWVSAFGSVWNVRSAIVHNTVVINAKHLHLYVLCLCFVTGQLQVLSQFAFLPFGTFSLYLWVTLYCTYLYIWCSENIQNIMKYNDDDDDDKNDGLKTSEITDWRIWTTHLYNWQEISDESNLVLATNSQSWSSTGVSRLHLEHGAKQVLRRRRQEVNFGIRV